MLLPLLSTSSRNGSIVRVFRHTHTNNQTNEQYTNHCSLACIVIWLRFLRPQSSCNPFAILSWAHRVLNKKGIKSHFYFIVHNSYMVHFSPGPIGRVYYISMSYTCTWAIRRSGNETESHAMVTSSSRICRPRSKCDMTMKKFIVIDNDRNIFYGHTAHMDTYTYLRRTCISLATTLRLWKNHKSCVDFGNRKIRPSHDFIVNIMFSVKIIHFSTD